MEKIVTVVTKILSTFLIFLMAIMVLDVSWQVFTRFILKDPSSFTEELAGFLLIWIGLLGASYAFYTRAHLGIDILTLKLSGNRRRLVEILINVIVFLFSFFILLIGGIRLVNLTFTLNQISPAMGLPMGYVYLVLLITGLLIMFYSVIFIISLIRSKEFEEVKHRASVVD
jgi:TRAP-type C4-dicarboxylate transport system permease small subunit